MKKKTPELAKLSKADRNRVSKTMADFLEGPLLNATWPLEQKHDRNRRPAFAGITESNGEKRWSVILDGRRVCVSPEPVDKIAEKECCPYQSAINKTLTILLNSDFAHDEGFVDTLKDLIDAREASRKKRATVGRKSVSKAAKP